MWFSVCVLESVPLVFVSVPLTTLRSLAYCSYSATPNTGEKDRGRSILFQNCFAYSIDFPSPRTFRVSLFMSTESLLRF